MKKAIMYGAGSIGRGFIGALLTKVGYEVVFVDVNDQVVSMINTEKMYPQIIMDRDQRINWITNIRAVDGKDTFAVEAEIATADLMATAVGANILEKIAPIIANGLVKRWEADPERPLDILICENLMDADAILRDALLKHLPDAYHGVMEEKLGIVETSIGRMVPPADPASIPVDEHPLAVRVEAYDFLPVDKAAFKGEIPAYEKIVPYEPFHYYLERKLYIHNMAHVVVAFLGRRMGATLIDEAAADPSVQKIITGCMTESAATLSEKYQVPYYELHLHIENLVHRFQNIYLKDTIDRVARDPMRKLQPKDRLVGAARNCEEMGKRPFYLAFAIALALSFFETNDPVGFLEEVCHIDRKEQLCKDVLYFYDVLMDEDVTVYDCLTKIEEYQNQVVGSMV